MEDSNRCDVEVELSQPSDNERPSGSWLCCLPCYWLKRNSGFHKMSLTVVTLLVTVLLVASPVLFLISSIPGEKSKSCAHEGEECQGAEKEKVCGTEECSRAGQRVLASVSWKVDPCQDFYQFACGSWEERGKNLQLPDQVQSMFQQDHFLNFVTLQKQVDQNIQQLLAHSLHSDTFQNIGLFYNSCLQEATKTTSLDPMMSLLEEVGGYVAPKEYPPEDLTDLVLNLLRVNGVPLFDIYLDSDLDNSSKWAPFIDLPFSGGFNFASRHRWHPSREVSPSVGESFGRLQGKGGGERGKVEDWEGSADGGSGGGSGGGKAYDVMKASMEEKRLVRMERILRSLIPRNLSSETRIADTQLTLHFASVVTKVYPREKEIIKNYQRTSTTKMRVRELEKKWPFMRWQYLLEKYLKLKVSLEDEVFVASPEYLNSLQRILQKFSFRVVHNGLLLIFATDTLYGLLNTSSTRDWPSFCTRITVTTFPEPVSILYVTQFARSFTDDLRAKVNRMFHSLTKSFERRLQKISWLDEETREAVIEKVAALRILFLSSSNYWNASYASTLMNNVHVEPSRFFDNVIHRYRQLRNVPFSPTQDHFDERRWAHPFVVNAFYVLTLNTIIIPLALLTHPYFTEEVPLYVPYSTVGLIIAHEMLHGFDLKGIAHDSRGHPGTIVSEPSRAKFEARLDCFVKQFSSSFFRKVDFLGSNIDIQFDWNLTKNENMADIIGIQLAYEAWRAASEPAPDPPLPNVRLSPKQLFFLNAAQTYCTKLSPADYIFLVEVDFHTPQPERVNGMMMNSGAFSEAYLCPLGSPMNPRKKCSSW